MGGALIPAQLAAQYKSIIVLIKLPARAAMDTGAVQNQQDGALTKNAPLAVQPSHGTVMIKKHAQGQAEVGAQINTALMDQPQLFHPAGANLMIAQHVQNPSHGIVLLKQTAKQTEATGAARGVKTAHTNAHQQRATM